MLYAGCDFEQWKIRANALLCLQDLRAQTYTKVAPYPNRTRGLRASIRQRRAAKVVSILCIEPLVSPAVLARISDEAKGDTFILWQSLESQSKSFRFLDLPAELRNFIHDLAIQADSKGGCVIRTTAKVHATLHVSRQIRREALPLFWTRTNLSLNLNTLVRVPSQNGAKVEDDLVAWMEHGGCSHLQYLRTFTLCFTTKTDDQGSIVVSLCFTFSKAEGLGVKCMGVNLAAESLERLNGHIARVERHRKILKLEGECIPLAVLGETGLWNNGGLTWRVEEVMDDE